jgi:hypothetical protein
MEIKNAKFWKAWKESYATSAEFPFSQNYWNLKVSARLNIFSVKT